MPPKNKTKRSKKNSKTFFSPAAKRRKKNRKYNSKNPVPSQSRGGRQRNKNIQACQKWRNKQISAISNNDNENNTDVTSSNDNYDTDSDINIETNNIHQLNQQCNKFRQQTQSLSNKLMAKDNTIARLEADLSQIIEQNIEYENEISELKDNNTSNNEINPNHSDFDPNKYSVCAI